MNKCEYKNIIAFHPGYYIADIIDELDMSQQDFATRLDVTPKTISLLLNGETPLTNDLASRISRMLGISLDTLLNLQKTFDKKKIEIAEAKAFDEQSEIVKSIDYSYFVNNGFLPHAKSFTEKIRNLCEFLKVSSLSVLKKQDLFACFRTTVLTVNEKNTINANVWVQTAINKGRMAKVLSFDEKKLKDSISEIRSMTLQEPSEFLPRLYEIFKDCGVSFVLLPALKNSGVNGFVKWCDDNVILALNDRFKYADCFWFSLFHEIKHVLQKKKTKVIVNASGKDSYINNDIEREADEFANEILIPSKVYNSFFETLNYISRDDIEYFADKIKIHPGIVVGRLQHDKKVPYSSFSNLREQYEIIV